jgi:hypothetical protein
VTDIRNVLDCPSCGGPVGFNAPFCFHCRRPLVTSGVPTLERGESLYRANFAHDPMPAEEELSTKPETTPNGAIVDIAAARTKAACCNDIRLRDGGVVLGAVALDPGACVGVLARAYHFTHAYCAYAITLRPWSRSYTVSTLVTGGGFADAASNVDWTFHDAIAPTGQPNTLEVLCRDSILQVRVNERFVTSVTDSALGFGAFGWRVVSFDQPGHALFQTLEIVRAR